MLTFVFPESSLQVLRLVSCMCVWVYSLQFKKLIFLISNVQDYSQKLFLTFESFQFELFTELPFEDLHFRALFE